MKIIFEVEGEYNILDKTESKVSVKPGDLECWLFRNISFCMETSFCGRKSAPTDIRFELAGTFICYLVNKICGLCVEVL